MFSEWAPVWCEGDAFDSCWFCVWLSSFVIIITNFSFLIAAGNNCCNCLVLCRQLMMQVKCVFPTFANTMHRRFVCSKIEIVEREKWTVFFVFSFSQSGQEWPLIDASITCRQILFVESGTSPNVNNSLNRDRIQFIRILPHFVYLIDYLRRAASSNCHSIYPFVSTPKCLWAQMNTHTQGGTANERIIQIKFMVWTQRIVFGARTYIVQRFRKPLCMHTNQTYNFLIGSDRCTFNSDAVHKCRQHNGYWI